MSFVRHWYIVQDNARMETLGEREFQDFTCFTIKWSAYSDTNDLAWSDDNRKLGKNEMRKRTIVISHLQLYGTTAVSISELIEEFQR